MLRYSITTLGCKVNQYDGLSIAKALDDLGISRCSPGQAVDLVVVNTCCVTSTAMRKSRQAIARSVRKSPEAGVLIVGCYGDYDSPTVAGLLSRLGVDPRRIVVSGHHDGKLLERIEQLASSLRQGTGHSPVPGDPDGDRTGGFRNDSRMSSAANPDTSPDPRASTITSTDIKARRSGAVKENLPATRALGPVEGFPDRQRAFVKVQDGCDAFCAYCIVPYTRCVVWSRPVGQVVDECRDLVDAGHKEIVLSGVFLGAFGRPTAIRRRWGDGPAPLVDLVRQVAGIPGLWRLRLSSLEPLDLTDELLGLWTELDNLAPHLHLPLQSGSPDVLRRMNRQYTPEDFRATIDCYSGLLLRCAFRGAAIKVQSRRCLSALRPVR